jgi:hypothetical protein
VNKKTRILIEMVDSSGNVLWSEHPTDVKEGYVVNFGPVSVDYTLTSPENFSEPAVRVIRGKFSGFLKVTVLELPKEGL